MLTLYETKKTTLTIEEMDGNFKYLIQRIEELEKDNKKIEEKFFIEKDCICLIFSSGKKFQIPLKHLQWRIRGIWSSKETYNKRDLVSYKGGLFICISETESENWEENCWLGFSEDSLKESLKGENSL